MTTALDAREITHRPAGSPQGGQFAPADSGKSAEQKKRTPAKPKQASDVLSYDPKSGKGAGYGMKGGHPKVRALQEALTRLGLTDGSGKKLVLDGKLGPKTTAAVKAAQRRLGVEPDGKVTPALLKQLTEAKSLPASKKRSAFLDLCTRSFDFELRDKSGDGRTLEGYAAVFNSPSRIRDLQGDFDEVILPGAFARSLGQRTPVLQWDHGKDPSVGTAPIGSIEQLREDDHGLYVRARLFEHPAVERIREAIAGRAIRGMSFRFGVPDKGDTWTRRVGDVDLREIRDADVHELGPVAFPAYDTTSVAVRSLLAQLDPDAHRTLLRELLVELRDLAFTGESDAWSADRGEPDTPGSAVSPVPHLRQRLDDGALRLRGIL